MTAIAPRANSTAGFASGALIGALGGLIGLGGAEFRLPLLIGAFRFAPLEAIILNKAMSLIVVAAALIFRTKTVPVSMIASHGDVILNLLAGSMLGAWCGASWATRLHSNTLYRLIAVLLMCIAVVLALGHTWGSSSNSPALTGAALWVSGTLAGFGIGVIASLLGVAGGELLIPTIVLLFGIDIKLAGSLSLAVSLPTMIVGFSRYSRDGSFDVLRRTGIFALWMALGSIAGAFVGGLLLGKIDAVLLHPLLAIILFLSTVKVWRHANSH